MIDGAPVTKNPNSFFETWPVSDIHMRRVFQLPILEIVGKKSGLHWICASEGPFSCTQKWTLLANLVQKVGLWTTESQNGDHFCQ